MTDLYKLTIPNTKITDDLTDFPVLLNFDTTSGSTNIDSTNLFDHFDFPISVDDDFTGTNGDLPDHVLWDRTDVDGTILINSNTMEIVIPSTANDVALNVLTFYKLSGDFDVQVDFELITIDTPSSSTSYPAIFRLYNDGGEYLQLLKTRTSGGVNESGASGTQTTWTVYTNNDTSGKCRLTRVGSLIKGYFFEGGQWVYTGNLAGKTFTETWTDDVVVQIRSTADFDAGSTVRFDNFVVNVGTVVWPADALPDLTHLTINSHPKHDAVIMSLNPYAYWRLGESSGTTAFDNSGNSYDGTIEAGVLIDQTGLLVNDVNKSMEFSSDGIAVGIIETDALPEVSISCLVEFGNLSANQLIFKEGGTGNGFAVGIVGSKLSLGVMEGSVPSNWGYLTANLSLNQTYHIVAIFDTANSKVQMYLDGNLIVDETHTILAHNGGCHCAIGTSLCYANLEHQSPLSGTLNDEHFIGTIDEVAVFDQALNITQVTDLYNSSIDNISQSISIEIDRWDHINKQAQLWTKIPNVHSLNDTTLTLFNSETTNPDIGVTGETPAQDVWTEYTAVYHLSKDGIDSTVNEFNGIMTNMDSSNIIDFGIGKGLSFNGIDEIVDVGNFNNIGLTDFSMGSIIEVPDASLNSYPVTKSINGGDVGRYFHSLSANQIRAYIDAGAIAYDLQGTSTINDNQIYSLDATFDRSGNMNTFVDGVYESSLDISPAVSINLDSVYPFRIGSYTDIDGITPSLHFTGKIKEVRFSKVLKSNSWVNSTHESNNDDLMSYESLQNKLINGTITENYTVTDWLARAWMISDGSLSDEVITSSGTFELLIPSTRAFPHMVTVSPIIGNTWIKSTITSLDDLIYPNDPTSIPYYYKCIIAGTTGLIEPTWTTGDLDQIIDDTVTWELVEGMIQPITQFPVIPS